MNPTRSACTVLLLATLAAVAPALDVEMRPTTIPGCFFHPEVGMMYVPLPKNLQMAHGAGVGGTCTTTVWFNSAGLPVVDTVASPRDGSRPQDAVAYDWQGDLGSARLVWAGSERPQNGLRAEIVLSALHYDSIGNARPEEPVEDGPHRRTLAPVQLIPRSVVEADTPRYGPPMVMEIARVRAYTATQRDFPARVIPPDFDAKFAQGVEPSEYCIPRVCEVRVSTIAVSQEQAATAGFVGEKRMGVRVRFGPSGRADHVDLYWPSGSANIDSLLARAARKATLRRNPGVSFAARPTVEMRYRATILRLFGARNPETFHGWLEPEALQLVTTE